MPGQKLCLTMPIERSILPLVCGVYGLLTWLGLVAANRVVATSGRSKVMHEILDDALAARVTTRAQPFKHDGAVEQVIFLDPAPDLLLVWIELGTLGRAGRCDRSASEVPAHGVASQPNFPGYRMDRMTLR